jgi:hypothetical protein
MAEAHIVFMTNAQRNGGTEMNAIATRKQVVASIEREFIAGKHQSTIKDLPFEIQFRTQCSWMRALTDANDIRVRNFYKTCPVCQDKACETKSTECGR